ncbi:SDR family oxidoreductase [uncultured Maribacter sp.]|uniref:SDR family oxidoreductase n=1 Tax=uncultured Maribacter sp. TaxID=431308 RepID=UPI00261B6392|nr:SDR family oxidoreductase [uncultured Maribacter sp.]
MVLVTGGTGLVGSHLLLQLVQKETPVKAIYRQGSNLKRVKTIFSYYASNPQELFDKIKWIEADLLDVPALETAFLNVEYVYHAAAFISFNPKDYTVLKNINVTGTANIVNLCIANKITKLAYVSTIGTIGKSYPNQLATEKNEWKENHVNVYALTKYKAELEVWRASQENVPVVIINPGVIVGPGFWGRGSGALFTTAKKGYSYYPPGGTGFVSIDDVIHTLIGLMHSDIINQRFITVSDNLSFKEILCLIAPKLGKKSPKRELKFWQLRIGRYGDWLLNVFTQKGRRITKNSIHSLKNREFYSSEKIKTTLPYSFSNLEKSIEKCCSIFLEEN